MCSKHVAPSCYYKFDMHELILTLLFSDVLSRKNEIKTYYVFPPHLTSVSAPRGSWKLVHCIFSLKRCVVSKHNKNSSGDEIANVNFFYNIAHVEASDYAH